MPPAPSARARGLLAGFANSADLGGLALREGRQVPFGRIVRANTPEALSADERAAADAQGFVAVLDLRSRDELLARPHPLAEHPGYRSLPLIDPDARVDLSRYRTLGEIYSSSLQRNAPYIAAIFRALAEAPRHSGPLLVSCHAGRDRTGMVVALLLDLAGVDHEVIAADYALLPELPDPEAPGPPQQRRPAGEDILEMLEHVRATYGTTAGYLRWLGLDDVAVEALRRRLEP